MTCEDCVHYDLCVCVGTRKLYPGSSEGCRFFTDKTRFVELPCLPGDPVYMIRECSCYCADEHRKNKRRKCREKVYLGERLRTYHCGYVSVTKFDLKHLADFGKTLFLTREEAEAALEKMKG